MIEGPDDFRIDRTQRLASILARPVLVVLDGVFLVLLKDFPQNALRLVMLAMQTQKFRELDQVILIISQRVPVGTNPLPLHDRNRLTQR